VELGDESSLDVNCPVGGSTLNSNGLDTLAGNMNFNWSLEDPKDTFGDRDGDLFAGAGGRIALTA